MASLSYHETLKIFIAALMAVSVLAADQDCSNLGSVRVMCNATLYPDSCYNSLVPKIGPNAKPQLIYKQSAEVALSEVSKASVDFAVNGTLEQLVRKKQPNNKLALSTVEVCRIVLSLASDNINNALSSSTSTRDTRFDIRTWLSAAGTDLETCRDECDDLSDEIRTIVFDKLEKSSEYTSNSLAIITEIDRCANSRMVANFFEPRS